MTRPVSGSVLIVAGSQVTSSDLHLLYHRAFINAGWQATFCSHDDNLPFGEKVLTQGHLGRRALHRWLFNRRVLATARACRPDLVFISGSNWHLSAATVRSLKRDGARVVLNEQHLQVFTSYQRACLPLYDHIFTQDSALPLSGRTATILGPACDPREHRPIALPDRERAHYDADVVYVGSANPARIALMETLVAHDLRVWGVGWPASPALAARSRSEPVFGLKKTKIYTVSRISLNLQSAQYQIAGVTCRPFEVAASGGFCLTDARPDIGRYFELGREMITFDGLADVRNKVAYFLAHEDERREIAALGRARALGAHTYDHRVREVLGVLGLSSTPVN